MSLSGDQKAVPPAFRVFIEDVSLSRPTDGPWAFQFMRPGSVGLSAPTKASRLHPRATLTTLVQLRARRRRRRRDDGFQGRDKASDTLA